MIRCVCGSHKTLWCCFFPSTFFLFFIYFFLLFFDLFMFILCVLAFLPACMST